MYVEYIQHMGDERMIARAAKVSTRRDTLPDDFDPARFVSWLLREGHTSPFEHAVVTMRVECPIFIARQIMRHRHFSFNEISGRYAEMPETTWAPGEDRPLRNEGTSTSPVMVHLDPESDEDARDILADAADDAERRYRRLLALGVANEVARTVLPVGQYTAFYITGNLIAWLSLLEKRTGVVGHPQAEAQQLARQARDILSDLYPNVIQEWIKKYA